jgi:hypothetical protein
VTRQLLSADAATGQDARTGKRVLSAYGEHHTRQRSRFATLPAGPTDEFDASASFNEWARLAPYHCMTTSRQLFQRLYAEY